MNHNNSNNNIFINVHRIESDGRITSVQYEEDFLTQEVLTRTPINNPVVLDPVDCEWNLQSDKINLNYHYAEPSDSSITVIKLGGIDELNPMNYATEITTVLNDPTTDANISEFNQKESKIPNIPTMIRCQNCDTNFPTKYQYQRHQCEFNAEKVVLKPDANVKDLDKGVRIKFDCTTCGKQFVSKNNLERHQTSHDSTKQNICEHCNKRFVSENRLRIHKENHCKKAGDISKFYRSDVAVWKCLNCNQVFATQIAGENHANICNTNQTTNDETNIQKILTELLLQCEFCNNTYADKESLSAHQRSHTTAANYTCVTCKEIFESYVIAVKHWMTKCTDASNLFYLPKFTYCETCDRTFKSHEILYTHKIKKKHYTPKVHPSEQQQQQEVTVESANFEEKKDAIVKLIEDVLTTLNTSLKNMEDKQKDKENNLENKSELDTEENGKNKKGRKRKSAKSNRANKKICTSVEKGYMLQCERCAKVFDNPTDMEQHREEQHASSYKCDQCSQVLHSAKALIIHNRAHQSLKPYVCETCGRSYSQTSHLWQHMRFHQGIKPFACPHEGCEARYTIRPDLKDHIRKVHTRERPFKCTVCGKCFLTGSVYYQHRLIHTNDRRYGCDICQKRFFRADALNNHKRIHTDERPYPCDICGREFRQKGDRNKHVRTQHTDSS